MARLNTFYLAPESWREPFVLADSECRHMINVLRTRAGDAVRLFDGQGREGLFTVEELGKNSARLAPQSISDQPRPESQLFLALGFNKRSRRDLLLEKGVELGASGIFFWQAKFSQGRIPDEPKPSWRDKFVQAAKQCGNPWLPELAVIGDGAAGLAASIGSFDQAILLWESAKSSPMLSPELTARPGRTLIIIGPEGGLDSSEAETLARAGCSLAHLGENILRWETAALLCMAMAYWNRQAKTLKKNQT